MNSQAMISKEVTFDQVFILAQQLRPIDQVRLVARLAPKVEQLLEEVEPSTPSSSHPPLRGILADLGPAPSAEEIDEVQHEVWATFGQV